MTIDYTEDKISLSQLRQKITDKINQLKRMKYRIYTAGFISLEDDSLLENQMTYTIILKSW